MLCSDHADGELVPYSTWDWDFVLCRFEDAELTLAQYLLIRSDLFPPLDEGQPVPPCFDPTHAVELLHREDELLPVALLCSTPIKIDYGNLS
jgi:hypothetical protein